ncbi:MAG: ATP-dependent Clp protease ATP-binding subunit ClpX [Rhodocyclaceae bacterium]|nr:MAG: ATP-dependent Clp protease ATP-binding subunit ClpX [Rhodocyclaceae bacterium]
MENAAAHAEGHKQKMTPSAIVRYLDRYVIDQDDAKKVMAVAVYSHYKKVLGPRTDAMEFAKSNILLVGPTGSGKTLLCETLAKALTLPFVTADATSLAQSKYVNEDIEAMLSRLLDKAQGDTAKAQCGIVFIDEIDKLKSSDEQERNVSGERVQHALLKIMEGARVKLAGQQYIDTTNILFICGGAFVGLEKITSKTQNLGFIAMSEEENQNILDRLNERIKPNDLFTFGLIPEFVGRLPIVARFRALSKAALVRVMTEPRNSIYQQFCDMLKNEGVELLIKPQAFEQIAELAAEYKVGARGLRGIFEELMTPVLYAIPDRPEIDRVVINSLFEEPVLSAKAAMPTPATD